MHLKRVRIKGLYGSLNKDVSFHPDLSLLVGINGSGKTSVLNVIDWLLRCDFPKLATTVFEELNLEFSHESKDHVLWAIQKKKNLKVHLKIGDTT
jgi:predicted ATP-dependent endonuclease of OLD family